jgi:hypothetical protein
MYILVLYNDDDPVGIEVSTFNTHNSKKIVHLADCVNY